MSNYITVKEYAAKNGITVHAVRDRIKRGSLPYKKIGEGYHSINLIDENEPWEVKRRGVKPGSKPKSIIITDDYITTREYADLHGLSIETVRARCKRGTMPYIKVGDSIMIDKNYVWEKGHAGRPKKAKEGEQNEK